MNRKAIFFIIIVAVLATFGILSATNARYTYSADAKGGLDLLQTKCSLELYNPGGVTGSTSGSGYKTENGTSYFAVPSIPTDYTNINYKVNNKVGSEINQKDIQYYIRVVAEDGSTNMPIEYNVHAYNDASNKYSLVSGWGYGPFTLQKNTEYSGTNGMFSIEANYTSIDSKYMNSVQKMKVQIVAKLNSGSLTVLSEAPLYMKITDKTAPALNSITITKSTYITKEPISATISATDTGTGIDITNCKYVFTNSNSALGISNSSYTGGNLSNDSKVNYITSTTGDFYLHVLLIDRAGNLAEAISSKIIVKKTTINVTEVIQNTAYSSGKDGFTFSVFLNGSKIKTNVINYSGTCDYGDKVRVVANAVSGYKLDNADVTKISTEEIMSFNPSWFKYKQATLKTYAEAQSGITDNTVKVDNFDSATNIYTITQKAGTMGWGSGTISDVTDLQNDFGRTYVLEFDIKVQKNMPLNIDLNNRPKSAIRGNDYYYNYEIYFDSALISSRETFDEGGWRNIDVSPNTWHHVKIVVPNDTTNEKVRS